MNQRFWIWLYRFAALQIKRRPVKRVTIDELDAILSGTMSKRALLYMPDGSMTAVDE